ncbi:MAG: hypothetical protein JXL85_05950 [Bacilli bacterium]|nr:hypothetical protein [Bacilli bacterium]
MKKKINKFMDWFETKFNLIIDVVALVGGTFCLLLAIVLFVTLIADTTSVLNALEYIIAPGAIGFFGVMILFALRITRHITKKPEDE